MSNLKPFVYLSKDKNELLALVRGEKTIDDVSKETFLFSPDVDGNLLSIEDTLMNGRYRIILEIVDPEGVFESKFLGQPTPVNTSSLSSYFVSRLTYFIVYGIGNDYSNMSAIQEVTLSESYLEITKGRKITLVFEESGSSRKGAAIVDKFNGNVINTVTGYSEYFSKYTKDLKEVSGPSTKYNPENAILDCLNDLLAKKYNSRNILILLPSLNKHFPSFYLPGINFYRTPVTDPNATMALSTSRDFYTTIISRLGFQEELAYVDKSIYTNKSVLHQHEGDARGIPTRIYDKGIPTSAEIYDKRRRLRCSIGPGTGNDSISSVVSRIVQDRRYAPIVWKEYVETDASLASLFFEELKNSTLLGGSLENPGLSTESPLIICGDKDLIDRYLYKKEVSISPDKELSKNNRALLDKLTSSTKYIDIRYKKLVMNETLIPFSQQSGVDLGSDLFVLDENFIPRFTYGGNSSNLTEITIEENPFYYQKIISFVSDTFDNDDVVTLIKGLDDIGFSGDRVITDLESYIVSSKEIHLDKVKNILYAATGSEISDNLVIDLLNVILRASEVSTKLTKIGEAPVSVLDLVRRAGRAAAFFDSLADQVYQVTVKGLPFFLKSSISSINSKAFLDVKEPIVAGSKEPSLLKDSSFYSGDYLIIGYRHKINSSTMFSEFKLVKYQGILNIIKSSPAIEKDEKPLTKGEERVFSYDEAYKTWLMPGS